MRRGLAAVVVFMVIAIFAGTASAAQPTFVRVKQAILSTGVTLCDLSTPGSTVHVYGQWGCDDGVNTDFSAGHVSIYTDRSVNAAKADAKAALKRGETVWRNGSLVVSDEKPYPGTRAALAKVGLKEQR